MQDVVETELLNEIAARSDSFFEAAESVQSLRFSMAETLEEIRSLRSGMESVNAGLCERARRVQMLSSRRDKLSGVSTLLQVNPELSSVSVSLCLSVLPVKGFLSSHTELALGNFSCSSTHASNFICR